MPRDFLKGVRDSYDVIVIGSGLAGMTAANILARAGHSVLLLEHHYQLGGMATWFKRRGGHIFDISLHGFPVGMIKSCRKYWTQEIADSIVQLRGIRFENPQFSLRTTFDRDDFTRILTQRFEVAPEIVDRFFDTARKMNFFDDQSRTTRSLFDEFFPGRSDIVRLLMEPITYANGSTLEDPAITYGIVFSNFMNKGVFTFEGGTDRLVMLMRAEMEKNGVDVRIRSLVEKIEVTPDRRVAGVIVNGLRVGCRALVSNANLKATILQMVGPDLLDPDFVEEARAVRLNNSSCQVYIALRPGERFSDVGDLLFHSEHRGFDVQAMLNRQISSRTFSFYYPRTRPGSDRSLVVSSTNANYRDWADLREEDYQTSKSELCETTIACLERYIPDIRAKIDYVEASTPRTFQHYTRHLEGASFGTKFEGLKVSRELPQQISGLYHAGSVGIIMSGWLGAVNYGVIVANDVDKHLTSPTRDATESARRVVLTKEEICRLIPHRDPFLWIDEVTDETEGGLVARKHIPPGLDVFLGHYPGRPVLPGVLLCEAAMQAGAVLIARQGLTRAEDAAATAAGRVPVATRINNVKFRQIVRPGDTLEIAVEMTDRLADAFFLSARITVDGKTAVQLDFACTLAST